MKYETAYSEIHLTSKFDLPSESQLEALESQLAFSMPDSYRDYLLRYNGGFFRNILIVNEDEEYKDRIDFLAGLNASHSAAELGSNIHLFDDNEPLIILPIGYTEAGVLLFTFVDFAEGRGEIYGKFPYRDDYIALGDDINEFFGSYLFSDETDA